MQAETPNIKDDGTPYVQGDHNWVSGSYPSEFTFWCKWCEDYARNAGPCPWRYWPSVEADFEAACGKCGECSCSDSDEVVATMCKVVGECAGLKYDVWENKTTGQVLCDWCFA